MPAHPDTLKDARRLFRKLKTACAEDPWTLEAQGRLHRSRRRIPLVHEWDSTPEEDFGDWELQGELAGLDEESERIMLDNSWDDDPYWWLPESNI